MEYLITDREANEQLVYFTSSSLTADNRYLFFISDSGGSYNIWRRDLQTGEAKRLSDNRNGVLKSYVYFRGNPYKGLGKASISVHPHTKKVYYIQDKVIMEADIDANRRAVAELPSGQMTAFTHVSGDGKYICVPTTDARALEDECHLPQTPTGEGKLQHDIDRRVQEENLNSYLRVFAIDTGREVLCERVSRAWITHVQFSPTDSSVILYNHEWPCFDAGSRRMWLFQNGEHICLRPASREHSPKDWTCHEMWTPDGRQIVYHGGYQNAGYYVGRVDLDKNRALTELSLPAGYAGYGHFTMGYTDPSLLVTDGYYTDGEDNGHDWISAVKVNWEEKNLAFFPLCQHHSPWTTQDSHPHPVFSHDDTYVYFTSCDEKGKLKVCRVQAKGKEAENERYR